MFRYYNVSYFMWIFKMLDVFFGYNFEGLKIFEVMVKRLKMYDD